MKFSESSVLIGASIFIALISSSVQAYTFYVGGRNGWVVNPSESYSQWAERSRFRVTDTLVFKYKKGDDSVLVVKKEDYDTCNMSNPIEKMDAGDSTFKFDRSGPFYFISGVPANCNGGQKLVVVVMAVRNKSPAASPPPAIQPPTNSPATSPASSPPTSSSPTKSPETSPSSISPAPTPASTSESPSPSPAAIAQAAPAGSPDSTPSSESTSTPISPAPEHKSSGSVVLSSSSAVLGAVAAILAGAVLN